MANLFVRSRPTANWVTGHVYSLGDKAVATSSTQFLGILFEVTTAGTSSGSEPAWNATVGGTTTDSGGVVWTTRGGAGIWLASKTYALGDRVVKSSQTSMTLASSTVWECTTAGTSNSSEPTWATSITAGTTTQADNTVTWTARKASTWDNAHPFLHALLNDNTNSTIKIGAGDSIYVSKDHAESWASAFGHNIYQFQGGTLANPNRCLCVDDTGAPSSPSTLKTTATISFTGSAGTAFMEIAGCAYIYGIAFKNLATGGGNHISIGATSTGSTTNTVLKFEACSFTFANDASALLKLGVQSGSTLKCYIEFNNTTVSFANGAQQIQLYFGKFLWKNTASAIQGTALTNTHGLFTSNTGSTVAGQVEIDGVDLSGLGSVPLLDIYYSGNQTYLFKNCKLNASFAFTISISASLLGYSTPIADFINCDSGGTNYKLHREHGCGTLDHELTKIKSGGASDGTTGVSWKMTSNANSKWEFPLQSFDIFAWNDNSGSSKTATVEILTDSATALNNDDVWLEVEYLADSGDPLGGFANNTLSNVLASNAAQTSSSVTWTTTGITNVMKQKLQVSFTPQQKGPVRGRVLLAKASTTVYVDPVLSVA